LLNGFTFVSVFPFSVFKSFSSSVIFSSLLLSIPIYPIIGIGKEGKGGRGNEEGIEEGGRKGRGGRERKGKGRERD